MPLTDGSNTRVPSLPQIRLWLHRHSCRSPSDAGAARVVGTVDGAAVADAAVVDIAEDGDDDGIPFGVGDRLDLTGNT